MKKILSILVIACIAMVFAGCQKDGVYNPSKKISKIFYTTTSGTKSLEEIWNWNDDNTLDRIDFYSSGTITKTYNFSYENKRLVRMNDYKNNRYIEYKYDGSHLNEANLFSSGSLIYIYKFTYKSEKLESMTCTSTGKGSMEAMEINPLDFIFGREIGQSLEKSSKEFAAKFDGKGSTVETFKFTWKNGEVSQMDIAFQGSGYYEEGSYKISYDNKKNPYTGALINFHVEDNYMEGSLSKHNILKLEYTFREDGEVGSGTIIYDYSYKDNYPVSKRETEMEGGSTYTGGLTEFEYVK